MTRMMLLLRATLLQASSTTALFQGPRLAIMPRAALHATRMQFDPMDDFGSFDGGNLGPRAPSDKQIQFAQRLASQLAISIPEDAVRDFDACRQFIDEALSRTPPSEKQLAFAMTIAQSANIPLPPAATASSKAVSEYIEANKGLMPNMRTGAPSPPNPMSTAAPTDKQIVFAAKLARERQLGLPSEALQTKYAMSQFIDACLNDNNAPPAMGGGAMGAGAMGGAMGMAAIGDDFLTAEPNAPIWPEPPMGGAPLGESSQDAPIFGEAAPEAAVSLGATEEGELSDDELTDALFGPDDDDGEETPSLFKEGEIPF